MYSQHAPSCYSEDGNRNFCNHIILKIHERKIFYDENSFLEHYEIIHRCPICRGYVEDKIFHMSRVHKVLPYVNHQIMRNTPDGTDSPHPPRRLEDYSSHSLMDDNFGELQFIQSTTYAPF